MPSQKISLVPQSVDLLLYAGDGAALRIVATDAAGAPVELDGTVAAQVRAAREDAAAAEDFDVDTSEALIGAVIISLTGEQTAGLVDGTGKFKGVWDCQWTATGGQPVTLVQGALEVSADVTR